MPHFLFKILLVFILIAFLVGSVQVLLPLKKVALAARGTVNDEFFAQPFGKIFNAFLGKIEQYLNKTSRSFKKDISVERKLTKGLEIKAPKIFQNKLVKELWLKASQFFQNAKEILIKLKIFLNFLFQKSSL